jgi:hypothetical protein
MVDLKTLDWWNKAWRVIAPGIGILFAAIFFARIFQEDQAVLDNVLSSVSTPPKSISLCAFASSDIPADCGSLNGEQVEIVSESLRQARRSPTPSHGSRKIAYFMKIAKEQKDAVSPEVRCFIAIEYVNFESELYLLPIETEEGCSGGRFKYLAGSAVTTNFLGRIGLAHNVPAG